MIRPLPAFPPQLQTAVNRYVVEHPEGQFRDRFVRALDAVGLDLRKLTLDDVKSLLLGAARADRLGRA